MNLLSLLTLAFAAQTPDTTTALHDISGVRVIRRGTQGSEVVAVRLYLLGGTRQYTEANAGIEPLILRAAELETWRPMARAGGLTTLETEPDWTVTGFECLREDLQPVWTVFTSSFTPDAMTEGSVKRARDELVAAARRRYSHPDLRLAALARFVAFQDHPYALDPDGTEESLTALERSHLVEYARAHFVTSRMLLVVVGDVTWSEVDSLVTATLGRLPAGDYQWTLPPPVKRQPMRWAVEQRPLATNYILGYFTGPERSDDDYYAFEVAMALLSSRLHRYARLRSLSYAASAPFHDWAIPVGGVYASASEPNDVYGQILLELRMIQNTDAPRWALSRFLDQWALDLLAPRMSSDAQAQALSRAQLLFGDFHAADEYFRRLRRVSTAAIRRVAKEYMRDVQFAFLGDTTRMKGAW